MVKGNYPLIPAYAAPSPKTHPQNNYDRSYMKPPTLWTKNKWMLETHIQIWKRK